MQETKDEMERGREYIYFEMLGDSMCDETKRSLIKGDVLKCLKIDQLDKIKNLKTFKYELVVTTSAGTYVGKLSRQDGNTVFLSKYNPAFQDQVIDLDTAESIYQVMGLSRSIQPRNKTKLTQTYVDIMY